MMMDLDVLLPILGLLFVVWVGLFIIYSETWQLPGAFIPISIGAYFYFDHEPFSWILFFPLLSLLSLNVNAVLSKPKFSGRAVYINYILILPFIAIYLFNLSDIFRGDGILKSVFGGIMLFLVLIYIAKFWISDVILLFVNQLYAKHKEILETEITHRFIKGMGKSRSFFVTIRGLGAIETSGFFYLYVGFRKITANDKVTIKLKTGCLGTEYISGLPQIKSRGNID